jgi:glycosyltransferase involved in cell wall biosynthesis
VSDSQVPLLATTGSLPLGGATTFLFNLGSALQERGGQLPVVSFAPVNDMEADFAARKIPVDRLDPRGLIYEDRILQVYRLAARWRPRAVLACLSSESFEVLRLVPPGVIRLGIVQSDDPGPYSLAQAFRPWLDAMVGVSPTICERLKQEFKFPRSVCIPYGIQFAPGQERRLRAADQPLRLIYVGRLIEVQKRVSRLVDLIRKLAGRALPFKFTFVGSGPELAPMRAALRDLPQVEFAGDVPNRRVPELLRAHDVFVLLSDFEGLPLSLLEAMGEGVVPVVSDLESGIRSVVTEATGIRVPVGDVAAAAEAVAALARDPARLSSMAASAARMAREDYSAARMAQRYLDLLSEFPSADPVWPERVAVPRPQLVRHGWLFEGWPRQGRRWFKRLAGRPS